MKTVATTLFALFLAAASSASSAAVLGENLLSNPGFEEDIVFEPPFDEKWVGFVGPDGEPFLNLFVGSTDFNPRTGDRSLEVVIRDFSGTFIGVFQQVTGLTPGLTATFSGWLAGLSEGGSADSGVELRIEWFDSSTGMEVGRTPDLMPDPGETYEQFSLTDVVPEGADSANVVLALQSFTGPAGLNVVFLDDASFTVVPLPGGLIMLLGALASLPFFRRGPV